MNVFLKKYVFSEKSQMMMTKENVYTFIVDKKLNKFQIKKEVELNFANSGVNAKVIKIRLVNLKKKKRNKNRKFSTKIIKKAFVKLHFAFNDIKENRLV